MPDPTTGKRANLQPESVGLEAQQASLLPHEVWEYDESQESPRDVVLKAGNRLTVPDGIVTNDLNVQRDLDVDRNLNVDGLGVIDGALNVKGSLDVDTNLNVDGSGQIDGALELDSTLGVDGATALRSTLAVTGITTLTGGKRVVVSSTSTSPVTITDTDGIEFLLVTTGASAFGVNLPDSTVNAGRLITVRKVDAGAGKITVDGYGAQTIDGNATVGIWYANNFLTFLCDGTGYVIIGAPSPCWIPEASRAGAWELLNGMASSFTDAWGAGVANPYVPKGVKSLFLKWAVTGTGDGAKDYCDYYLRKNGSSVAAGMPHQGLGAYWVNFPNGQYAEWYGGVAVECDANGIIEYQSVGASPWGGLFLATMGFSMLG